METNLHVGNQPNEAIVDLANHLANVFQNKGGIPNDNQTKNYVKDYVSFATKVPPQNSELRMDFIARNIGILNCMGNTATISRRLLATIHYHSLGMMDGVILIAHSHENTVKLAHKGAARPNEQQPRSNGNRATADSLLKTISALGTTFLCPFIVIEIDEG